jgi:hypothetical protein
MNTAVVLLLAAVAFATALESGVIQVGQIGDKPQMQCWASLTIGSGVWFYNLTSLWHTNGNDDMSFTVGKTGDSFFVNLCGTTKAACKNPQSVCQRAANLKYFGCGVPTTQVIYASTATSPEKGIMVGYGNGDKCTDGPSRSTVIQINCNPTAVKPVITNAVEGDCDYTISIDAVAGCGVKTSSIGGGGIDAGGIILIILLVLVVVYFAGGAVYQWKIKGATAPLEFIIHREFWFSIPLLIKDGSCFIAHGFKKGDYTAL